MVVFFDWSFESRGLVYFPLNAAIFSESYRVIIPRSNVCLMEFYARDQFVSLDGNIKKIQATLCLKMRRKTINSF